MPKRPSPKKPSEERFSKWHEFALFVLLPTVIVLVFSFPICLLWSLLLITFCALCDLARKFTNKWHWPKWMQAIIALAFIVGFLFVSYKSINERTRPVFVYLRPGIALNGGSQWTLNTVVRTNRPVYNIQTTIDDAVTSRAIREEKDQAKVEAMIRGSHVSSTS